MYLAIGSQIFNYHTRCHSRSYCFDRLLLPKWRGKYDIQFDSHYNYTTLLSNRLPICFTIFLGFRKVSLSMADANASNETIKLGSETKHVDLDQGSEKAQSSVPKLRSSCSAMSNISNILHAYALHMNDIGM